jgi:outer membrane protein OmpA-like peptidoglycan-associated protein
LPVCALALSVAAGLVPVAHAQGIEVRFSTRVASGEKPTLTLRATEALTSLSVELQDDTGQTTRARFGVLARGASRTVALPAVPGRRRYTGKVVVTRAGRTSESPLTFETVVAPRLEISIDKARVDLANRRLEVRLSRPAARAEIKVVGAIGGSPLVETEQDLGGRPAGEILKISWPAPAAQADAEIGRIDLRLHDTDGFHAGISLYPWSVHIPHEEVNFATDSAAVAASEEPKLEASYRKIAEALARHRELGPIKVYIAGHTDTVGKDTYNLQLSERRARAIAAWFRRRGLRLPILYEGFGEYALREATPDETGQIRNRRVDYILAVEDPVLGATRFRASWKTLP